MFSIIYQYDSCPYDTHDRGLQIVRFSLYSVSSIYKMYRLLLIEFIHYNTSELCTLYVTIGLYPNRL
jgi:hypothetical protein